VALWRSCIPRILSKYSMVFEFLVDETPKQANEWDPKLLYDDIWQIHFKTCLRISLDGVGGQPALE
jgi:hypothetical protein